jgi:phage gpG-like protein
MSQFRLNEVATAIRRQQDPIMREVANMARNHYVNSFRVSSWEGKAWRQVQRRIAGTGAYKYPKNKGLSRRTKPILVNKGTLRRKVNNSVKSVSNGKIVFEVDLPYAKYHNEGTGKLAKRQFMGWSKKQGDESIKIIEKHINRVWQR